MSNFGTGNQDNILGKCFSVQCCLRCIWTTLLHWLENIPMQAVLSQYGWYNNVHVIVFIKLVCLAMDQHYTGKNLVQYCIWGSRRQCTRKNPVQWCINTLGTTLQIAQVKTLCNVAKEAPDNIAQEKTQPNVVWTSLFSKFYFGPVYFLITTSCCTNIAQISLTFHKENPVPRLNKKTRLYKTKHFFSIKMIYLLTNKTILQNKLWNNNNKINREKAYNKQWQNIYETLTASFGC